MPQAKTPKCVNQESPWEATGVYAHSGPFAGPPRWCNVVPLAAPPRPFQTTRPGWGT